MTEYLFCCFYNYNEERQGKFRRVDKSMIGLPTNFQHCAHIGCGDITPSVQINNIETQMNTNTLRNNTTTTTTATAIHNNNNLVSHLKLIDLKTPKL